MICPNCGETLKERERSGIEIDVCPVCRGVWLDRGELDKLIDRESRYAEDDGRESPDNGGNREYAREGGRRRRDDRDDDDDDDGGPGGFFQRLTDIFGGGDD